jgi:hypothetical protein
MGVTQSRRSQLPVHGFTESLTTVFKPKMQP